MIREPISPISRDAVRRLVEPDRVHRDVYLSAALFELEQRTLFANAWLYVGHASQIPQPGDFITLELAGQPVIMVRDAQTIRVLANRCAHKGAMLTARPAGRFARTIVCPYHGWAYRTSGALAGVPRASGYEGTGMRASEAAQGLRVIASAEHRGFVFARIAEQGESFAAYAGPILHTIDALADRSPEGELEVAGSPLRNVIRCNWKIYLENINDSLHAPIAHESASLGAGAVWGTPPPGMPKPMIIEQLMPFASGIEFMEAMGAQVFANGHSILGVNASIHSAYGALPEYEAAMRAAYGERAGKILSWTPQNAIVYPSIAIKAAPQTMRVIRALGPDRTLVEAWAFRAKGAPEVLLERTLLYNRLVFSPMSVVAADDIHIFETIHRGLRSAGNEWVSLHRDYQAGEIGDAGRKTGGMSEILMRNQFRAWAEMVAR